MENIKVYCHMYLSIDGKSVGEFMNEDFNEISGNFYDDQIFQMGNTMANGKLTWLDEDLKNKISLEDYKIEESLDDYIIKDDYYHFIYDRTGESYFKSNKNFYGGKLMQIVMVLTPNVDKRYLSYLKSVNISYIICPSDDYIKTSLIKARDKFGIKDFVLTGGALINGGFFKEDLIDVLSLVISPNIDGEKQNKAFIEIDKYKTNNFKFEKAIPLGDGGVSLIFNKNY